MDVKGYRAADLAREGGEGAIVFGRRLAAGIDPSAARPNEAMRGRGLGMGCAKHG